MQPNWILYSDPIPALTLIHQDLGQRVHQVAVIRCNWGHYLELAVQQLDTVVFTQNSSSMEFLELCNAEMIGCHCWHAKLAYPTQLPDTFKNPFDMDAALAR
jgi:hypothetical protein